ncbi:MAG: RNA polymerase sigma factor [Bacteriovoracaceae bacterium]|nr:RNA polymerase sigma factor [Bacteriovoracaceae bacterium]
MSDNLPFSFSIENTLKESNRGNKVAYAELLEWLYKFALAQIGKMVNRYARLPKSVVDDVAQEVLITFHEKHKSWDENRPLTPWVNTIIKHKFLDHIKRKDFRVAMNGCSVEEVENVLFNEEDQSLIEQENWELLLKKMDQLSEKEKKMIELSKLELIPIKKIGEMLKMSESNVKVQIFRAMKKLKKSL